MPESEVQSTGCFSVVVFVGVLFLGFLCLQLAASRNSTRQFLYIGSEPHQHESIGWEKKKMYPLEDPFHGVRFAPGTTLELLGSAKSTFTVTSSDESPLTFENEFWVPGWGASFKTVDYEVMSSPWDTEQDRPFCVSDPVNFVHSYFLWFVASGWRCLVLGIIAAALIALASAENSHRLWALPVVVLLVVVTMKTSSPDDACVFRHQLETFRTSSGRILPVPDYRIVAPYGDRRGYVNVILAQALPSICLWFINAIVAVSIVPAIRGAHYLFVPHPAEQHVRRRPGKPSEINVPGFADSLGKQNINNPPPDFVLKNQTRRIHNLAKLLRAEREAADEVVRHQRSTRSTEKKP